MISSLKMEGPGKLYLVPIRSGRSGNVSLTFTMAAKGGRPVDPIWLIYLFMYVYVLKPSFTQSNPCFAQFYPVKPMFYPCFTCRARQNQ